jgi:N-acyl-D-glutamate deacylase
MGLSFIRFLLGTLAILNTSTALVANDIVIMVGRVIDPETRLDAFRNVAIEGDKIVAISEFPLEGGVVIDATGHVVSSGFIMQSRTETARNS